MIGGDKKSRQVAIPPRKEDIESEYGEPIVWQRLTDKISCRVKDEREYLCFDIEDKTEVFAF